MPRPKRSIKEFDDDLLLKIFSMRGWAQDIAKFSLVCKRWRDLSYAVNTLSFEFLVATEEELRSKEDIILSMLCRACNKAPGRLKHLNVEFGGAARYQGEVRGDWLLYTTSDLTTLNLVADDFELDPVVWNTIMHMTNLEGLTINGKFWREEHLLLPRAPTNCFQMTRLLKCEIVEGSVALLETILGTCPALEDVCFCCDNGAELRVASNSLKIFSLTVVEHPDGFEATIDAPGLTTFSLYYCHRGQKTTPLISINFESAQSLRTAKIHCPCKLHNSLENLQKLKVYGTWPNLKWLLEMLMHTPMITDLHLYIEGESKMCIDHVLTPLVNLKNIHFNMDATMVFREGRKRFEALNVHVRPSCSLEEATVSQSLLKALIEVHKVQSLVVNCGQMSRKWRSLLELSHSHSKLVSLVFK